MFRSRLAYRLFVQTLLFSAAITLLGATGKLYLDYQGDVERVRKEVDAIEQNQLAAVSLALWNYDMDLLKVQLEGLERSPELDYAELSGEDGSLLLSVGKPPEGRLITRTFKLPRPGSPQRTIGSLKVMAGLETLLKQRQRQAFTALGQQGIQIFLVGSFILFLVHYVVTRHLQQMARYARELTVHKLGQRLSLARYRAKDAVPDELDQVVTALNDMQDQLGSAYRELASSKERLELVVTGANDGLWDWNVATDSVYYSPRFLEMLGMEPNSWQGKLSDWVERIHPSDSESTLRAFNQHLSGERENYETIHRVRHAKGYYLWFLHRGRALRDSSGAPVRMGGTFTDISLRKAVEEALHQEKERALVTLQAIADGVICTDAEGRIEYINPVGERLTGWSAAEVQGRRIEDVLVLVEENERVPLANPVRESLARGEVVTQTQHALLISRHGVELALEHAAAPIHNRAGLITGVVMVFRDVTEQRHLARQISYQAEHDSLTGLLNRRAFEQRLERLIGSAQEHGYEHTLLYMDLDQFKIVNDTCGHSAGDALLCEITALLRGKIRDRDAVARLGGDEFAALLEHCAPAAALRVANHVLELIRDFRFVWQDKVFSIGVSIGLVPITRESRDKTQILASADSSCYAAKDAGRNRIHIYQPDDAELAERHGQMQWIARITEALEENRLKLYAQTIRALKSDEQGDHYEILVRMDDGKGNIIPPGAFLPAAERYNCSHLIDEWVIENTLKWLSEHPEQLGRLSLCAINLSGQSIGNERLLNTIIRNLHQLDIPARKLCWEVTETAAIANLQQATLFINSLRALGCKFALDDFGSGMSSFAYLKHLPVDYLKIDGSFVRDAAKDPIDLAMVKSINEIGHLMGKRTIAEFVEDDTTLHLLTEVGVDYAQGYGIAKPVALQELAGVVINKLTA
ncbi:MAG: EAL domain-containing protein [Gammaproteobacteria bacterium]|nr:EAL domain-containing protein [Gammaproteobacteria bacterium]